MADSQMLVFVGSYASAEQEALYVYRFDSAKGALQKVSAFTGLPNPTFLALHPGGRWLYSIGETGNYQGKREGCVAAFAVDSSAGTLKLLNQQSTGGPGPCHLSVDAGGRCAVAANYSGGSVCALPIGDDGLLKPAASFHQHSGQGPNAKRQEGPHAHSANLSPDQRFVFVCDLGIDRVVAYALDAARSALTPYPAGNLSLAPGAGPRHMTFHPSRRFAYVINELGNTVDACLYDETSGTLRIQQSVPTLPQGYTDESTTADVHVSPDGRFLYGSNRGHDSLAIYAIDPVSGLLAPLGHESTRGRTPRNFGLDPSGNWLLAANQATNNIIVFRRNPENGRLTPAGAVTDVPRPVCVKFLAVKP